MKIRRVG
jgi:hypothetical protein